jgi:hypothetical protein
MSSDKKRRFRIVNWTLAISGVALVCGGLLMLARGVTALAGC